MSRAGLSASGSVGRVIEHDLRLVPAALVGWAASVAVLVSGPGAFVVVLAAAVVLWVVVGRWALRGAALARGLIRPLALVTVAVLVLSAIALARVSTVRPVLVTDLAERRAEATVELVVAADPMGFADSPVPAFGPERFLVRAQLVRLTADGQAHVLRVPVVLRAPAGWGDLLPGTRVRAPVDFRPATRRTDAAMLTTRAPPEVLAEARWAQRWAARLRDGLRSTVADRSPDVRGLVPGMVLGDTTAMPAGLHRAERTTGLAHLTAVSGANVAVLLGAVLVAVGLLGGGRRVRLVVGLATVVGFVLVVRPEPSVLRAAVMGSVLLLAITRGNRTRGIAALSAAVLVLLAVDPWLGLMAGFTLSVLATGSLLLVAPVWVDSLSRRMPRMLAIPIAIAAAAHLATVPVIAALSGQVSLVAVLANVLAEPAVVPVTVAGSAATVLEPIWPGGARACALIAAAGAWWVAQVAHRSAALPAAAISWPSGPGGVAALIAVAAAVVLVPAARRGWSSRGVA